MGILYEHWRTDLNECFYVGISWERADSRPWDMTPRNYRYEEALLEIDENNARVEVKTVECSWLNKEELGELERLQISYFKDLIGDRLTNIHPGGFGILIDWDDAMRERHSKIRSFEERSETTKRWQSQKTPEERRAAAQKGADSQTPEQHRNNALKAAASQTYEQRCQAARKRVEGRTHEQFVEAGRKSAATRKAKREAAGITHIEMPQMSAAQQKRWDSKTEEDRKTFGAAVSAGKQKVPAEQRTASAKKAWETRRAKAAQQQQVP